jgi:hypothetical protein
MEKEVGERGYYEEYFSQEIKQLIATKKGILKHTTTEDEVEQWSCDTMTRELWESELRGFLNAPEVLTMIQLTILFQMIVLVSIR